MLRAGWSSRYWQTSLSGRWPERAQRSLKCSLCAPKLYWVARLPLEADSKVYVATESLPEPFRSLPRSETCRSPSSPSRPPRFESAQAACKGCQPWSVVVSQGGSTISYDNTGTALGPVFIGGSVGDTGHATWFFALGRVFRVHRIVFRKLITVNSDSCYPELPPANLVGTASCV